MGTEGERAALVSGHNLYTEEGGDQLSPPPHTPPAEPPSDNILGQFHQDALLQVGLGWYQWLLALLTGLCLSADGAQVFLLPYITPSIQAELCLSNQQLQWITGVSMIGLTAGALLTSLGDHVGRRCLLLFALCLHFLFNLGTFYAPTFGVLITSRLGSSIGVGMCYPLACIYFAEYLPQAARSKLSILLLFWALGGFYVVMLAYLLLPNSGEEVVYEVKSEPMQAWRRVLLFSSLPALLAFCLILPLGQESVRYLLHTGKDVSAILWYQQMYKWNAAESTNYQLTELELPSKVAATSRLPSTSKSILIFNIRQFFDAIKQFGHGQNLIPMILLSVTWASLGFSYYSLSQWVPLQLQRLKDVTYFEEEALWKDTAITGKLFDSSLENRRFENMSFNLCTFAHMSMSHVLFKNCLVNNTDFSNIHSSNTYFIDSIIENSRFFDTDFTPDRFINTRLINNSYMSTGPQCRTDLNFRIRQTDKIRENMLRLITPFVSLTIQCLCLYAFPRNKVGVGSMLLCSWISISCWFLNEEIPILIFDFIWSIIFLFAFNAVNIITVEAFPVHLRATGFGICFAWFRLFGLMATSVVTIAIPLIISLLIVGGMALFRTQDTSHVLM